MRRRITIASGGDGTRDGARDRIGVWAAHTLSVGANLAVGYGVWDYVMAESEG